MDLTGLSDFRIPERFMPAGQSAGSRSLEMVRKVYWDRRPLTMRMFGIPPGRRASEAHGNLLR